MEKIIVDGTSDYAVPRCESDMNFGFRIVVGEWDTRLCATLHEGEIVYCWLMDDRYCPVVYIPVDNRYYVCAKYKTYKGFLKWLEKYYPQACLIVRR